MNHDETKWLLHVLGWLDRVPRDDKAGTALNHRVCAELCVRFADAWVRAYPRAVDTVGATARAAEAWLQHPDDAHWTALYRAATMSYGYGPGEGCHSIAELGPGCGAGTGCRTGIGWVWSAVHVVGAEPVAAQVREVLGEKQCAALDREFASLGRD